ncbi:DUF1273 family protein [Candidatus Pacearchaeota archaeon]|nr:DUF1273 family protein [Candidatus Pacearchaeota archaeon]
MYKVVVTGHRPQKLNRSAIPNIKLALLDRVKDLREQHPDLELITGMALGVDTWFAEIAIKLDITFHAALPFAGQDSRWRSEDRIKYQCILDKASSITICDSSFSRQAYFDRNTIMVEMADECIAVWDGAPSGTGHAVGVAQVKGLYVDIINPNTIK